MKAPADLNLSSEQGDALIERLERDACTPEDRQLLVQVLRLYFWLLFALKETKLSLNRFRLMLFGEKAKSRQAPSEASSATERPGGGDGVSASGPLCGSAHSELHPPQSLEG